MFHHFYLVLLLAVTCYGQYYSAPQTLRQANGRLTVNQSPIINRLPIVSSTPKYVAPLNDIPKESAVNVPIPTTNKPKWEEQPLDSQYDRIPDSYRDAVCKSQFGYYKIDNRCDSYIECRNYRAAEKLCPDGTHYNAQSRWPEYPCGYPMDVPCQGQDIVQPAKSTVECSHQFGFYPMKDTSLSTHDRCSRYVVCAEGQAKVMDCPFGLAFNEANERCDWPELVPSCKDFLGFTCPALAPGEEDLVRNYKYSDDECYYFWSCQEGRARVLSCDNGLAFDPYLGRCVDEDLAPCKNHRERNTAPIRRT